MKNYQKKQIVIDDLILTYYLIPSTLKKGSSLVFLHGWGANSLLWLPITEELSDENYTMYFLDLPGFGLSQHPKEDFTLTDYSQIVTKFIRKLGLSSIHLIGHSFGGKIGIKILSQQPKFIKSLILVDASGLPHRSTSSIVKIALAKLTGPLFSLPLIESFKEPLLRKFGAEDYVSDPQMRKIFINVVNEDVGSLLPLLNKPTQIIWGRDDRNSYTPLSDAYVLNKTISGSKLAILNNATHYSFLDSPKEFTKALIEFINTT